MLPPAPQSSDGFTAKPSFAVKPRLSSDADDVPQGDELFQYVVDCLDKGSLEAEVRKQLIVFGYSAQEAGEIIHEVASWQRRNPGAQSIAKSSAVPYPSMWIGGIACLIGITGIVGSLTTDRGCTSVIPFGVITCLGASQFFRGLSRSD